MRHGVAAAPTHADHLDHGALTVRVHQFKHGRRSLQEYKRLVESFLALSSLLALSASKVALEPRTHALEHRLAVPAEGTPAVHGQHVRSEERRVGKECRSRW